MQVRTSFPIGTIVPDRPEMPVVIWAFRHLLSMRRAYQPGGPAIAVCAHDRFGPRHRYVSGAGRGTTTDQQLVVVVVPVTEFPVPGWTSINPALQSSVLLTVTFVTAPT
jgi:hypothetical protein